MKEPAASLFQHEKDSLAFLGLMAIAFKGFDYQFKHNDGELTHAIGLNIFAIIVDNKDGEVLSQCQNQIHAFNNPNLHAEQLALKEAVEKINMKRPRNYSLTSVESYYRNFLFNDPASPDNLNTGCTIYTTLEPCPFCTSALLVNRMKRIVYVMPDEKFGGVFEILKAKCYERYDITCEKLNLADKSALTKIADQKHKELLFAIDQIKKNTKVADTLLLDYLNPFLKECYDIFSSLTESNLESSGEDRTKNYLTLNNLKHFIGF